MNDMLLDDVTSLLDGDFGDDRILKQISRACKNNEVISNYERNYVEKLAEQYLGKKPKIIISKKPENTAPIIPDVAMPKIESYVQTQTFQSRPSRSFSFNLKNPKLIFGFTSIVLVIIFAAILSSGTFDSFSSNPNPTSNPTLKLSIETDSYSYSQKDIISINGMSTNSNMVNISIENQNNELVWAEQVSVKNSGMYSTLSIAGGSGWENSGTYTMNVDNGSEIKSITFSFTS
jgi:FlaG/FlaF family flagellin (archaellin)